MTPLFSAHPGGAGGANAMSWENITDKFSSVGEGFGRFAKRLLGSENEREVKRLTPIIAEINSLEDWEKDLDLSLIHI